MSMAFKAFFFLHLSLILVSGNICSYKMRREMFLLCFYSKFHPKISIFELKVVCISLLHVSVYRSVVMSSRPLVSDWDFLPPPWSACLETHQGFLHRCSSLKAGAAFSGLSHF